MLFRTSTVSSRTATGNAWASGTFYGAYDFGTGTTLTALSSDAFLVKYDSTGAAIQQWNFGDAPSNHDQTSSGLAVAHNGNVLVMGSFTAEIDFDSAGSNTGSSRHRLPPVHKPRGLLRGH
jgi:hypothetical protein